MNLDVPAPLKKRDTLSVIMQGERHNLSIA